MHDFLVSAGAFVILIGLMVIVHEFGHFAVAKLCGVRVEAFALGFGPRLFGFKYGDTEYKVCLLPLGGYVKMTGEAPEQNIEAPGTHTQAAADDPGAFTSHPRWQRMLIGLAGPISNFILAFVLMVFYYGWFNEVPSVEVNSTTVEWVTPDSAAAQAGLQPGDVIRHFDNADNPTWEKVFERVKLNAGQELPVIVQRGGAPLNLTLRVPAAAKGDDFDLSDAGLLPQYLPGPIGVEEVQPGTPAERAGLRAGDAIESVDGHAFHTVGSLLAYMQTGQGKPIALAVIRNGSRLSMEATPAKLDAGWKLGFVNMPPPFRNDPLPLKQAMAKSTAFCEDNAFLIVEVLERLFLHKVSVSQLSGPVGIARMAGEAAEMKGWFPKFGLAGEISLNLGIINLLPFPILDGGMIFLLLIESTIGHDIAVNVKERIYQAAFVVIIAFFAFVIFNDVTRLPIFTHLKP
jgi:regulator of sigma E protease